jgi:hypothetical protein
MRAIGPNGLICGCGAGGRHRPGCETTVPIIPNCKPRLREQRTVTYS